jgi:hypothetical protein
MRLDRYALWIAVWEFFQTVNVREVVPEQQWKDLHGLLDQLWEDERADAKPDELAAHAGALNRLRDQFKPKDVQ